MLWVYRLCLCVSLCVCVKIGNVLCSKCFRSKNPLKWWCCSGKRSQRKRGITCPRCCPCNLPTSLICTACKLRATYDCYTERLSHLSKVILFTSNPGQLGLQAQPWMEGLAGARLRSGTRMTGHPGRGSTMRKGSRVERSGAGRAACIQGRKEDEARKGGGAGMDI